MSEPEFKPKSNSKSLSLKHYSLLHLSTVIQTHTFFQNILDSKAISSLKYHLAYWSIFPSSGLSSCVKPSAYFLLSFSLFKVCHSPLRWQAEGWWWEGGDRKFTNRRGCQEWTGRGSQRTHLGDDSPAVSAYVQLVCLHVHADLTQLLGRRDSLTQECRRMGCGRSIPYTLILGSLLHT